MTTASCNLLAPFPQPLWHVPARTSPLPDSSPPFLSPVPSVSSTGDPSHLAAPPATWPRCHVTHLYLDRRSLPLGSCMEYRCQKVPVWLNLFYSQKHNPGRTAPCTQQDTHTAQPRGLGLQRQGGRKSGSRCQGTQYLQPRERVSKV